MKRFSFILAVLALALVFGLAFAGCDSSVDDVDEADGIDRTIPELYKRVKSDYLSNYIADMWADIGDQGYIYCTIHVRWEIRDGSHTAAVDFDIANATSLSGWFFSWDGGSAIFVERIVPILDSFFSPKYRTGQRYSATSIPDGTHLTGWYNFFLQSDGTGGYGGKAGASTTPLTANYYKF